MARVELPFFMRILYRDAQWNKHCLFLDSFEESDQAHHLVTWYGREYWLYQGVLNEDVNALAGHELLSEENPRYSSYHLVIKTRKWAAYYNPVKNRIFFDYEADPDVRRVVGDIVVNNLYTEEIRALGVDHEGRGKPVLYINLGRPWDPE